MKILLLLSEAWDDRKHGNNNMTNWFTGFEDAQIATIYCSEGMPENQCCQQYFQITDRQLFHSLKSHFKAGRAFVYDNHEEKQETKSSPKDFSKHAYVHNEIFRFARDLLWATGRIHQEALQTFVKDFAPDIVFTQRKASIRILRVEREVRNILPLIPFVAYTADDECSLAWVSSNPLYWVRRYWLRRWLQSNASFYSLYYVVSEVQARIYQEKYQVPTQILHKCGNFNNIKPHETVHTPITFVYAGKLYCNRDQTLEQLAQAIHAVNTIKKDTAKLKIYTQSPIKKQYARWLDNQKDSMIMGCVTPATLKEVYEQADIVLHVEGMDRKNRLITRYSFSTKVIDCLATGCAFMVIASKEQSALAYLRKEGAAMVVDNVAILQEEVRKLCENPDLIAQYANKALQCGKRNHQRDQIQQKLQKDFSNLITQGAKS